MSALSTHNIDYVLKEILKLKMGPGNLMVVTDVQIMRDLIDNKSYSSADREPSYPISIVTDGKNSIFGPYSEVCRFFFTFMRLTVCSQSYSAGMAQESPTATRYAQQRSLRATFTDSNG